MISRKLQILLLVCTLLLVSACAYIVIPEEEEISSLGVDEGWSAFPTHIGQTDSGDLQIELTIRNDTANWSAPHSSPHAAGTGRGVC